MFTTASVTCSARSASEAGPLARAGIGRAAVATEAPIRIEAISARARERGCACARSNDASGALATGCMVDLLETRFRPRGTDRCSAARGFSCKVVSGRRGANSRPAQRVVPAAAPVVDPVVALGSTGPRGPRGVEAAALPCGSLK